MSSIEKTSASLQREKQKKVRLERNLTVQRERLRKADVRRKIQLGGLIVKAGLEDESAAVLLGILNEAKQVLLSKTANKCRAKWQKLGDTVFNEDQKSS